MVELLIIFWFLCGGYAVILTARLWGNLWGNSYFDNISIFESFMYGILCGVGGPVSILSVILAFYASGYFDEKD